MNDQSDDVVELSAEHKALIEKGVAEYEGDKKSLLTKLHEQAAAYAEAGNDAMAEYMLGIAERIEQFRQAEKRARSRQLQKRKAEKQARRVTRNRRK